MMGTAAPPNALAITDLSVNLYDFLLPKNDPILQPRC